MKKLVDMSIPKSSKPKFREEWNEFAKKKNAEHGIVSPFELLFKLVELTDKYKADK